MATMKVLTPDDKRHGTIGAYSNHGCKCDRCRDAWNAYARDLRRRRMEAAAALREAS